MDIDTKMYKWCSNSETTWTRESLLHRHHDTTLTKPIWIPCHPEPSTSGPPHPIARSTSGPNELMFGTKIDRTKGKAKTLIVIKVDWVHVCSRRLNQRLRRMSCESRQTYWKLRQLRVLSKQVKHGSAHLKSTVTYFWQEPSKVDQSFVRAAARACLLEQKT